MASDLKKEDVQEIIDTAIEGFAEIVNGAFTKQQDLNTHQLERLKDEIVLEQQDLITEQLKQQKEEIFTELDNRNYVTKHDLDDALERQKDEIFTELDDRHYVTKHDLNDAVVDIKDEIISHIEKRLSPLEQRL